MTSTPTNYDYYSVNLTDCCTSITYTAVNIRVPAGSLIGVGKSIPLTMDPYLGLSCLDITNITSIPPTTSVFVSTSYGDCATCISANGIICPVKRRVQACCSGGDFTAWIPASVPVSATIIATDDLCYIVGGTVTDSIDKTYKNTFSSVSDCVNCISANPCP
jgi:hypothetical protein